MKLKNNMIAIAVSLLFLTGYLMTSSESNAFGLNLFNKKTQVLTPVNQQLVIPISTFDDGKAHHFKVKSDTGIMVTFFALKSKDGVIRAAIDACDVCFRSGKGYVQQGDNMVCINCGQKFSSNKINIIKGGCNPAPLNRFVKDNNLLISMKDINLNSWYCQFKG